MDALEPDSILVQVRAEISWCQPHSRCIAVAVIIWNEFLPTFKPDIWLSNSSCGPFPLLVLSDSTSLKSKSLIRLLSNCISSEKTSLAVHQFSSFKIIRN